MKLLPKCIWKTVFLCFASVGVATGLHAQDTLKVDSVVKANRGGVENTLLGNIAGLRIKNWSGTPGTQGTINLRGLSLDPTNQTTMPLILINGVPMVASPSNITGINPLNYFSIDQVERIEVIKEIDRLAAYGVQAPNGAIILL